MNTAACILRANKNWLLNLNNIDFCRFCIVYAYVCVCYTVLCCGYLACLESKLIPKPWVFRYLTVLIGLTTREHYTKLQTCIHAQDWFQICHLLICMHQTALITIGNIQVYLCHTVTRHTPLVKQLNIKMPLCIDIMPRKYLDEIQAPN